MVARDRIRSRSGGIGNLRPDDLKMLVDIRENGKGTLQWVILVASHVRTALAVHAWIEGYLRPVSPDVLEALEAKGSRRMLRTEIWPSPEFVCATRQSTDTCEFFRSVPTGSRISHLLKSGLCFDLVSQGQISRHGAMFPGPARLQPLPVT